MLVRLESPGIAGHTGYTQPSDSTPRNEREMECVVNPKRTMSPLPRLLLGCCTLLVLVAGPVRGVENPDLSLVLERLDRLSQLYEDRALGFTCNERITYRGKTSRRYDFSYLYVLGDDGQPRDLRRSRGLGRDPTPDSPAINVPTYLLRPYSAVFIFQRAKRDRFDFELVGSGNALGRPAIKIGFAALPPYVVGQNAWFGTAWIDRDSFQLLRVEAYEPEHHARRQAFERARKEAALHRDVEPSDHQFRRFEIEFGVVENGMRFPSRVTIEERRYRLPFDIDVDSTGTRVWTVEQEYKRYRFYSTRAEQQIWEFVIEGKTDKTLGP